MGSGACEGRKEGCDWAGDGGLRLHESPCKSTGSDEQREEESHEKEEESGLEGKNRELD